MGRRALSLLAGMLILASMPEPVLADSVVDQANPAHVTSFGGTRTFAQTVTVGLSGILTGVDLYLSATAETKITASITSLYRGSGLPFGPALASATVQVSSQTWYHFEFPVPVTSFRAVTSPSFSPSSRVLRKGLPGVTPEARRWNTARPGRLSTGMRTWTSPSGHT